MAQSFTIVGGGRVGTALAEMGQGQDVILQRGDPVPPEESGPIVVCTRNDSLDGVVKGTPPERRGDLVFIQNGMLQPWLDSKGLGDNTQVLVYFAVAKKGDLPTDGITDANPEGLTAATGKHAESFAQRLHDNNLSCHVLNKTEYTKGMLEKLIWICAFMLVGTRNGGCTVGEVADEHREEVSKLIEELAAAGSAELNITLHSGYVERLLAYAKSVAHFPTAVKEVQWRNGWFLDISKSETATGKPDPCPIHSDWMKEVGAA